MATCNLFAMLVSRLLIFIITAYECTSLWLEGSTSTRLPRADDSMAICYDAITDTILLFGGEDNPRQFVTFRNHQFTDVSRWYLTTSQQTASAGQHYTQLGHELWIIDANGNSIITIDTDTHNVIDQSITLPISTSYGGCLTSIPGFLIVVGGGGWSSAHNRVQIYNLGTTQWLSNVPSLTYMRMSAACVVVNDKVYAIGGDSGPSNPDAIEELDVSNLPNTAGLSWTTLPGTLASGRSGPRAVVHGTDIYVMGGDTSATRAKDVNVIDTISGSCEVRDTLAFGTSYASSIIVNNVLYSFGGWVDVPDGYTAKYQYTTLPDLPTKYPSKQPTIKPSKYPSKPPTNDPSNKPSNHPSKLPTSNPSIEPSNHPTNPPTSNPNKEPSKSHTNNPSNGPSRSPIIDSAMVHETTSIREETRDAGDPLSERQNDDLDDWQTALYIVSSLLSISVLCMCILCVIKRYFKEEVKDMMMRKQASIELVDEIVRTNTPKVPTGGKNEIKEWDDAVVIVYEGDAVKEEYDDDDLYTTNNNQNTLGSVTTQNGDGKSTRTTVHWFCLLRQQHWIFDSMVLQSLTKTQN
eukprot:822559_1